MGFRFVLLLILAYLLGSVPAAYIVARLSRGVDIRKYGSGNVGGSNLLRVAPKRVAIPGFIFDVAKGIFPVFLGRVLGLGFTREVLVGLAAVAGHNWSVFLGFSGGRGIATTLGIVLFLMPKLTLLLLAIVIISIPFRLMATTTILVLTLFPVCGWFSEVPLIGLLFGRTLVGGEHLSATLALLGIPAIAAIRRLLAPRSVFTGTVSRRELVFYRLFFDRDIKDREAWVDRNLDRIRGEK